MWDGGGGCQRAQECGMVEEVVKEPRNVGWWRRLSKSPGMTATAHAISIMQRFG